MERRAVRSSNINSIGYDPASQLLEVEFRTGLIYQYHNVPLYLYEGLMEAPSHGRYLSGMIKDRFRFVRVR